MSHSDFSSWSREQEATFVVYEQRNSESQKKAWTISIVTASIFFVAALGIFMGVEPEHKDMTKGMNMSNLTKKKTDTVDTKTDAVEQK